MTDQQQQRQELLKRRDELRERLEAIKRNQRRGLDPDWEEQAIQLENADVEAEIARVTAEELAKVDAALAELDS